MGQWWKITWYCIALQSVASHFCTLQDCPRRFSQSHLGFNWCVFRQFRFLEDCICVRDKFESSSSTLQKVFSLQPAVGTACQYILSERPLHGLVELVQLWIALSYQGKRSFLSDYSTGLQAACVFRSCKCMTHQIIVNLAVFSVFQGSLNSLLKEQNHLQDLIL